MAYTLRAPCDRLDSLFSTRFWLRDHKVVSIFCCRIWRFRTFQSLPMNLLRLSSIRSRGVSRRFRSDRSQHPLRPRAQFPQLSALSRHWGESRVSESEMHSRSRAGPCHPRSHPRAGHTQRSTTISFLFPQFAHAARGFRSRIDNMTTMIPIIETAKNFSRATARSLRILKRRFYCSGPTNNIAIKIVKLRTMFESMHSLFSEKVQAKKLPAQATRGRVSNAVRPIISKHNVVLQWEVQERQSGRRRR
jgi:hypothetical protein